MIEAVQLKFKRINKGLDDISLPVYSTEGSAGMDIFAASENSISIAPGGIGLIPTNLSVEIPTGFELQVRPRSGLAAKHGIGILNSPGTIDSDYRGEIKIIMINLGKEIFVINPGERIAQLILSKVYKADITESSELKETKRGEGGFGHTGR